MPLALPEPGEIRRLGPSRHPSPLRARRSRFIADREHVLVNAETEQLAEYLREHRPIPAFEVAGPREQLYFEPGRVTAGIVTCGGLCPGLNDVVRALTLTLWHQYGVRRVLGFRYGYLGLSAKAPEPPLHLDPEYVSRIHDSGGTVLGTSRGPQSLDDMIDTLTREGVDMLFTIGGDGTLRGAWALEERLRTRRVPTAVVGIPKTIDNDIHWVERSFGLATAVEAADVAIACAHAEARGVWNGIGIVKLMGRRAGFIAAYATLANNDVNFCLVPEFPVPLEGERGLLRALEKRLAARRHAVIAVAEGFGQDLLAADEAGRDASGNTKLGDIGPFLVERIRQHFVAAGEPISIKYIDPSYIVRSMPANSHDAELCTALAQHAVHAAMTGRTGLVIGRGNGRYTHVPIPMAVATPRCIPTHAPVWQRVLDTTGQAELLDFYAQSPGPQGTRATDPRVQVPFIPVRDADDGDDQSPRDPR
jgi:6-phosphofructokinase 1